MLSVAGNVLNLPFATRMVDVLRHELKCAEQADLTVSFVRSSGLQMVLPELKSFLARGGALRVLASTYLGVTDLASLRTLEALAPRRVRVQQGSLGFHAKTYAFRGRDFQRFYVGSSNWTKAGIADNLEWNVLHDKPPVVTEAEALFEQLWARPDVVEADHDFITRYEKLYRSLQARPMPPVEALLEDGFLGLGDSTPGEMGFGAPAPRPDQLEALERLDELREGGARRGAVIAATGTGKTLLTAFHAHRAGVDTLLFVAHRKEILEQAQQAFRLVFGPARASALLVEGRRFQGEPFVFATVQALTRARQQDRALFDRHHDLVVIDEFHHAEARTYRQLMDELRFQFLLGLTATPERTDGHDVLELCDFNVAYELRLPEAIRRRLLLPFHYFGIADELVEYARIPWRNGQFDPAALENALILEGRVDQLLAHATEKGFDGTKRVAVGFCAGVRHARFMAEAFERRGVPAEVVTGADNLSERKVVYARLQDPRDELEWLFVSDVLNEGVDLPAINTIAFLRPTTSTGVFLQQLGRGLRLTEGTEVLTVLDFVGHHKAAFSALAALDDETAPPDRRERDAFGYRAPERCEFVLEDRTREILSKVQETRRPKKESYREAYERLREELGRAPTPMDTWERTPAFKAYRDAFGSWLDLRIALGDAEPWELPHAQGGVVYDLLRKAESDWQEQRVTSYAALWAAMETPGDLPRGYDLFFQIHPQWKRERVEDAPQSVQQLLASKLARNIPKLFVEGNWIEEVAKALEDERLRRAVQERVHVAMASDFKTRHCGVLRKPDALRRYVAYSRREIVNHFETQYDPTVHNAGVLKFAPNQVALLVKLDTSSAKRQFQYTNSFEDDRHFLWTSQNRMRRDNEAGREITEHVARGTTLHLFVQPRSHQPAMYLGCPSVVSAEGDAPMRVTLRLEDALPAGVRAALGARDE